MILLRKCLHRWLFVMRKLFWISSVQWQRSVYENRERATRNRIEGSVSSEADWRNKATGQGNAEATSSWKRQGLASAIEIQGESGRFHILDLDILLQSRE